MYSLVLMMALSGSAETPAGLFHKGGCNGCSGASCSGGSCSGCTGGYACSGGGCHGSSSCHGCSGGSKHGCNGGGLFSGHKNRGCHGCNGGCSGGYGCSGSYGCSGGYACTGGAGCVGGVAPAPAPMPAPAPAPAPAPEPEKKGAIEAPATIVVTLPADAKLTIDGNTTRSTTANRTFVTPALATGMEFSYTLKAEIVRDGQTYTTQKNVTVRGGAETKISLDIPVTSVAAQ